MGVNLISNGIRAIKNVIAPSRYDYTVDEINDELLISGIKNPRHELAYVSHVHQTQYFNVYWIKIPNGYSASKVEEKVRESLETRLNKDVLTVWERKQIGFKVYHQELAKRLPFEIHHYDSKGNLILCLGMGREGLVLADLTDDLPHIYVGGGTGSGKSTFTNALLCMTLENMSADELSIVILDLKGNEFYEYRNVDHVIYHCMNVKDALEYFKVIEHEVNMRYQRMIGYRSLNEYNLAHADKKMKRQFIIVEEVFNLIDADKECVNRIAIILSKARACGVHFLFTTQRATNSVLPNEISTHLGLRIGLRCTKAQESINLIGENILASIRVKGRGYHNANGEYQEFQPFHITTEQIKEITAKYDKKVLQHAERKTSHDES